jgi:GntR family transcriptional regulator
VIDHGALQPPSRQLADILRAQVASGHLSPGDRIPSIQRLAQEYGIAGSTVQKGLAILKDEGILVTVPSFGTFVAPEQPE